MDAVKPHLVLGGPGTGKTTRLLNIVAEEISHGVPARAIAFVTFTRVAALEAKQRAATLFNLNPDEDLPWFRTIHSLAYAQLGTQKDEVMGTEDWTEFGTLTGEFVLALEGDEMSEGSIGTAMLRIVDYAATTMQSLEDAWHQLGEAVERHRLQRFATALTHYKTDIGKVDFTDLVVQYAADGAPVPVRVAVIDEAQDLTKAQWAAVTRAFSGCERIYIGGDDDQAIYHWAGADVGKFLSLSVTPEVLPTSHRLPKLVHAYANQIAHRISRRYVKEFAPTDRAGDIHYHMHADVIDFSVPGTWFLLARNTYMLRRLEGVVREWGVNYSRHNLPAVHPEHVRVMKLWEQFRNGAECTAKDVRAIHRMIPLPVPQLRELTRYTIANFPALLAHAHQPWFDALNIIEPRVREYYLSCLRRGESLSAPPRIRIDTIHGVKGAQADHVVLMTDLSRRTARAFQRHPDPEHRVFYVGVTRAQQSLHIVLPQSGLAYPMP